MSFGFQLMHAKPSRTWTLLLSWILFTLGIGALFLRFAEAPPGESRGPRHADRLPDVPRHDRRHSEARRRRRCNRPRQRVSPPAFLRQHALERHRRHFAPLFLQHRVC